MSGPVGILGGAFDPPHNGHVALAREAVDHFGLERLLVRVVADPGHKEVDTAPELRLELAELAFAPIAVAEVSLDPFARTVDSLEALQLADPVFLLGADELAAFPTWTRPERVLELARIGAATRPGTDLADLEGVIASLSRPGPRRAVPDHAAAGLLLRDPRPGRGRPADRRPRAAGGCRGDSPPRPLSRRLMSANRRYTPRHRFRGLRTAHPDRGS